ncbi:uncharacterized protein BDR25DRAFT_368735 [Lindgomyces ingoldianus]|uniref:Uncharacterized protein n=1 Tax=Lindgomyces ingoldianus TaxID=673940 RepID=A0ACB6QVE0_9PLEO|nr:uncharacterized protein BDR25DRAFT_368735 [Lindgomyces ingoldianus]KAF2471004.1 hypothetical protein BDR25DRAFT_368735 [Lindgomyces ingoldianus]
MTSEGSRHAAITSDDHGALLTMTAWFLSCTLVLFTTARLTVRFTTQHMPGTDDVLIVIAGAFAIGSTIAISFAVNSGLGKRSYLLAFGDVSHIQKDMYVATILYVLTVGVSKFSIAMFLSRLACARMHKVVVVTLSGIIICWTTAATFGVSFQCELPRPWEVFTGKCIPLLPFWISVGAVDVLTDLVMVVLPIHIVWDLQMAPSKKAVVIFIFTLRSVLIAMSILRLIFFTKFVTADPAFDSIPYGILTQCHSTLSVIVACSPALKPFMDNVTTGMLSASLGKHTTGTTFGYNSYNMQPLSNNSKQGSGNGSSKRLSKTQSSVSPTPDPKFTIAHHIRSSSGVQVFVKDNFGRLVKQPLADIESAPASSHSSKPRSLKSPPPPRPPPPPEELRPDLSAFMSKVRSGSPMSGNGSSQSDHIYTRYSEESGESGVRIIEKTRAWDMRHVDYHEGAM